MSDVCFYEINILSSYSIYSLGGFSYGFFLHFPTLQFTAFSTPAFIIPAILTVSHFPLLHFQDISLVVRGRLYISCVQSSMLHGSETWPVRKGNEWHFSGQRWEWLDGCVALSYKIEFQVNGWEKRLELDDIISVLQQNRLWWYGHVLRKEDNGDVLNAFCSSTATDKLRRWCNDVYAVDFKKELLYLTRKQEGLRKLIFIYNYGITSYCLSPGGITFYLRAHEIQSNGDVQNVTSFNLQKSCKSLHGFSRCGHSNAVVSLDFAIENPGCFFYC